MLTQESYNNCNLCPRRCSVDRSVGQLGACGMPAELYAARAALHLWEEPCISGTRGSGTVFFSGCSLGCVFCQNRSISHEGVGFPISAEQLSGIFLRLQDVDGANNINLVTPSHYVPHIIAAIERARAHGLLIPIVYNSSGYDSVDSLRALDGLIDVYLPDFKYISSELSSKYSAAPDYYSVATAAIDEMFRQVGEPLFAGAGEACEAGTMMRGVIVRHLILPNCTVDSREIIAHLHSRYKDNIYISIMNQYTPISSASLPIELTRSVTDDEYNKVVGFARRIGVKNGFVQEGGTALESFIPIFDGYGIT